MNRSAGRLLIALGVGLAITGAIVALLGIAPPGPIGTGTLWKAILAAGTVVMAYGLYLLIGGIVARSTTDKRRRHNALTAIRLAIGIGAAVAISGLVTEQWVGLLVSLGVVGLAVTVALQQPLFSVIGWLYILTKGPYGVGDRVKIGDARGDVIDVDVLVTTLWEINGDLVSSNQPSGRLVTLPNSTVLSSQVFNYSWDEFPYVWNEVVFQVAFETDLSFARRELVDVADELLGDEMAANIAEYRELLAETPVELEVQDRPTVNVHQAESWVELRVRYLTSPKGGQRIKNELYARGLERLNEYPDRIKFPVGRNR